MLPSSHVIPIKTAGDAGFSGPRQLADAFSEFISASAVLEGSYRELQQEVAQLNRELAERNAALTRSLAENDRMRATLEQTIDSMPCGVLVLDAADRIVRINPEGRRLLGPHSGRAQTLAELARSSGIDFDSVPLKSVGHQDHEVCLSQGNSKRWLGIRRRELSGNASDATASLRNIWILRDVTAQKQAEQQRESARRATTLAEISTILAHEIRNPLASLELFAGLIAEGGSENGEWIGHLRAGIRTLSGTVNNVLSLNGTGTPRMAPLDLNACVRGGVDFVQPIAEQAGVLLGFEPAEEPLTVRGNEDAIRQILLNLICNAIRHTSAGDRVDVLVRQGENYGIRQAMVEVRDTGCGIAEEAMGHLFEAGFSGTGETPGLGLAVCQRLMKQHGGTIAVTSRLQTGTNFQLEFPAI